MARRTAEEWDALVQQQGDSGLSIAEYARREGLVYQTCFGKCRSGVSEKCAPTPVTPLLPDFVELEVAELSTPVRNDWLVELYLGGGITLRVCQPDSD